MKFISSSYDEVTGISTVIMQHLGERFIGAAKIHPEEKEKASEFTGCRLAEIRAMIKGLKYEKNLIEEKIHIIQNFIKDCECYKNFEKGSDTSKVMYRQLNRYFRKKEMLSDAIKNLNTICKNYSTIRDNLLKKIKEINRTKEEK